MFLDLPDEIGTQQNTINKNVAIPIQERKRKPKLYIVFNQINTGIYSKKYIKKMFQLFNNAISVANITCSNLIHFHHSGKSLSSTIFPNAISRVMSRACN